jgi:hypothetical protein
MHVWNTGYREVSNKRLRPWQEPHIYLCIQVSRLSVSISNETYLTVSDWIVEWLFVVSFGINCCRSERTRISHCWMKLCVVVVVAVVSMGLDVSNEVNPSSTSDFSKCVCRAANVWYWYVLKAFQVRDTNIKHTYTLWLENKLEINHPGWLVRWVIFLLSIGMPTSTRKRCDQSLKK